MPAEHNFKVSKIRSPKISLLPAASVGGTNSFFFTFSAVNSFFTSVLSQLDLFLLRDFMRLSKRSSADSFTSPLQRAAFFCTSIETLAEDCEGTAASTVDDRAADDNEDAVAFEVASSGVADGDAIGRALIGERKTFRQNTYFYKHMSYFNI